MRRWSSEITRLWRRLAVAPALWLHPEVSSACAVCIDSAVGDRGFNVAFVGLMLAPFLVVAGLFAVLAWGCTRGRRGPALTSPRE